MELYIDKVRTQYCKAIKDSLGIDYLSFIELYEDDTFRVLNSDLDVLHDLKASVTDLAKMSIKNLQNHIDTKGLYLLDYMPTLLENTEAAYRIISKHGYHHILINATSAKVNGQSAVRYSIFATKINNKSFNNVYINNKFLIENFTTFFHEKLEQDGFFYNSIKPTALYPNESGRRVNTNLKNDFATKLSNFHTRIKLTNRQKEIIFMTIDGKTSKEIAEILNISKRTVEHHFESLIKRFRCNNKYHVIYYLIKNNFIIIND